MNYADKLLHLIIAEEGLTALAAALDRVTEADLNRAGISFCSWNAARDAEDLFSEAASKIAQIRGL